MCALFTGNSLILLDDVESTNSYLANLTQQQKLADGTVVWAQFQWAGKGQRENHWQSEKGKNLTFSILYFPKNIKVGQEFLLMQSVSVGIAKYLKQYCDAVKVKWPNDIYVAERKIAGILIENNIKGEHLSQVIIGVGLNVNQQHFFELSSKATSLAKELNYFMVLKETFDSLLTAIENAYLQWQYGNNKTTEQNYLKLLYKLHEWHEYTLPEGKKLWGKIVAVLPSGHLEVETRNGEKLHFAHKEIIF